MSKFVHEEQKNIVLASLRAKYTTENLESNEREIRDSILAKNKYLHLAYWLEMNRSDWANGYNYAKIGLNNFNIENSEDELIHDNISKCIENWDSDGRIFRDTVYNYTVIYGKVDNKELLSDLELLLNYCEFN